MLRLEQNKNYLLGFNIINEAQIRTMSRQSAKIGDRCSVIIDERISRDLWGQSGTIIDTHVVKRVKDTKYYRGWEDRYLEDVTEYFLKFDDEDFRMDGVWLELEQLF